MDYLRRHHRHRQHHRQHHCMILSSLHLSSRPSASLLHDYRLLCFTASLHGFLFPPAAPVCCTVCLLESSLSQHSNLDAIQSIAKLIVNYLFLPLLPLLPLASPASTRLVPLFTASCIGRLTYPTHYKRQPTCSNRSASPRNPQSIWGAYIHPHLRHHLHLSLDFLHRFLHLASSCIVPLIAPIPHPVPSRIRLALWHVRPRPTNDNDNDSPIISIVTSCSRHVQRHSIAYITNIQHAWFFSWFLVDLSSSRIVNIHTYISLSPLVCLRVFLVFSIPYHRCCCIPREGLARFKSPTRRKKERNHPHPHPPSTCHRTHHSKSRVRLSIHPFFLLPSSSPSTTPKLCVHYRAAAVL
ncbi:hypothetical protein B0H34DRAFT_721178 [Crassisporium funariophilum]|nr:hypothetical protein B0H34DRAFT_721178 [Crassisporium funariophilum]